MFKERIKSVARKILGKRGIRALRVMAGKVANHRVLTAVPIQQLGQEDEACSICPSALARDPIVYTLGIGKVINTDIDLIRRYKAQVFAFDPTPGALEWVKKQTLPDGFTVVPYGVSDFDGRAKFFQHVGAQFSLRRIVVTGEETNELEVRRLASIMRLLGHNHIDLLKINIEGGEYVVIADFLSSGIRPRQIWVEFHHRFRGYRVRQTYDAVRDLNAAGYRIIWISEEGRHYTFLHEDQNEQVSFSRA